MTDNIDVNIITQLNNMSLNDTKIINNDVDKCITEIDNKIKTEIDNKTTISISNKLNSNELNSDELNSDIKMLQYIHLYLIQNLTDNDLYELATKCNSITKFCKGDGAGLLGGSLIDLLISKFFETKLDKYFENKQGEADMKICDLPLSLKKINGKSTIALDWSKNNNSNIKEYFTHHIILINLKSSKWWKNKPKVNINNNINYNNIIYAGIYIIDKNYCKNNIKLSSNNKTNTLIDSVSLYHMITDSIIKGLYIKIPHSDKNVTFNILNAFS